MTTTQERRAERLDRLEHVTELPLLVLALLMILMLLGPVVLDLSARVERVLFALDWMIWGIFAAELSVRTYLAPSRLRYLWEHWFDVLLVALGHVPQVGVTVHHPYQLLAGSLQEHLLA